MAFCCSSQMEMPEQHHLQQLALEPWKKEPGTAHLSPGTVLQPGRGSIPELCLTTNHRLPVNHKPSPSSEPQTIPDL